MRVSQLTVDDELIEADDASGAMRRCIATGDSKPVDGLIRFVVGPDTALVPDLAHVLPGRGIWVSSNRDAIVRASKGLFSKAAKSAVQVDPDLAGRIETLLVKRIVSFLSLSRRANEIIMGYTKVEAAFAEPKTPIASLIIASDSGASDRRKVLQMAARRDPQPHVIGILTSDEISLAFGRENVVHAALKHGGLAERVWVETGKLTGFRPLIPKDWGPEA